MRRELKENRVCSERKREREDTERDRERAVWSKTNEMKWFYRPARAVNLSPKF
jgi:hypothetical protein